MIPCRCSVPSAATPNSYGRECEAPVKQCRPADSRRCRGGHCSVRLSPIRCVAGYLRWVLKQTRRRVRCRENLRFRAHSCLSAWHGVSAAEMGRRFASLHLIRRAAGHFLPDPRRNAGGRRRHPRPPWISTRLVTLRRAEFDRYQAMPAPADRFETRGIPYVGDQFAAPSVDGWRVRARRCRVSAAVPESCAGR